MEAFSLLFFFFLLLVVCADSERIGLVACGQESYITLTRIHSVARRLPVGAPVYPRVVSPTVPPRARCTPDGVCNAPRLDGGVTTVENDSITCCLRLYTARVAPLEQVFLSSRASLLIRPSHFLPCFCCSAASHNPIAHAIHTAETTGPPQFSTKSVSASVYQSVPLTGHDPRNVTDKRLVSQMARRVREQQRRQASCLLCIVGEATRFGSAAVA